MFSRLLKYRTLESSRTPRHWKLPSTIAQPNHPRFFPGLPRQHQLFLDWRSYGGTRTKNISLAPKVKPMRTLILSSFLYAFESWTLTPELERRIHALEMRCYRKLLNISYKDRVTNGEVRSRIQNAVGVHDGGLTMVKKRNRYGHISMRAADDSER